MDEDHKSAADPEDKSLSTIERTLKYQVNNPEFADCVFLVGEQRTRIYAHKCLLAMNNPVFKSMFFGELKETKFEIEIPDLHEKGFLHLIRYLYTNKIPYNYEMSEIHWTLAAAGKYLAFDFINELLDMVGYDSEDDNACQTYDNAFQTYHELLKLQMDEDDKPYADDEDEYLEKLERTLKWQVNNPELADCVFLVGEQRTRIYAHKCLLAMNNPVFKSMFYGELKETKEIEVPDLHEKGFLHLLRYLYTNQTPYDYEMPEIPWTVAAADKYLAFDFIKDFLYTVESHMQDRNECQTYDQLLKLQLDDESLVKLVEKLIKRASNEIKLHGVESHDATEIDRQTLESILRFDQLYTRESKMLSACLYWTDEELKRRGLEATAENKRSLFAGFKHLILFDDLEASDLVSLKEYLEINEMLSVLLHSADKSEPLVIEYRSPRVSHKRLTAEIGMSYAGLKLRSDSYFETECKFRVNKRVFLSEIETQPILIDCRWIVCEIFKENKRLGKWECSYNDYSRKDYEARNTVSLRLETFDELLLELEPDIEYKLCFSSPEPLEKSGRLFYGKQSSVYTEDYGFHFIGRHCIANIEFYRTAPLRMCEVLPRD